MADLFSVIVWLWFCQHPLATETNGPLEDSAYSLFMPFPLFCALFVGVVFFPFFLSFFLFSGFGFYFILERCRWVCSVGEAPTVQALQFMCVLSNFAFSDTDKEWEEKVRGRGNKNNNIQSNLMKNDVAGKLLNYTILKLSFSFEINVHGNHIRYFVVKSSSESTAFFLFLVWERWGAEGRKTSGGIVCILPINQAIFP